MFCAIWHIGLIYVAGAIGAFAVTAHDYDGAWQAVHSALLWPIFLVAYLVIAAFRNLLH